jgi:hypothetical protein
MGDSIFDIMIVLIPLAIFISRIVVQARGKHKPQPPVKRQPITVHFEDDDERLFTPSAVSKPAINKNDRADIYSPPVLADSSQKPPSVKKAKIPAVGGPRFTGSAVSSAEQARFFLNLNHLSPMKQAVVMAEILGPPKGSE